MAVSAIALMVAVAPALANDGTEASGGDHCYTLDAAECLAPVKAGWREEGIAWYGLN